MDALVAFGVHLGGLRGRRHGLVRTGEVDACDGIVGAQRARALTCRRRRVRVAMSSASEDDTRHPVSEADEKAFRDLSERLRRTNVYFVGMMGSGKSSVGKLFAQRLKYRFLDTDVTIERLTKSSITELFANSGEAAFRELETAVLAEMASYTDAVISTGGGIVLNTKNWSFLQTGLVCWLDVPVDVLVQRLADDTTRPLLQGQDPAQKLSEILAKREAMYKNADVHVPVTEAMSNEAIAQEACRLITNFVKANPPKSAALYPGKMGSLDS
ncbi:Shikimate kinase [Porphyridium purpureum]|uniref:shikimate kinase n=1 Tax=Porphyridium purpureum TaxID=35688 RepID=A0A5J4Z3M2_PORPP|nr:Shikimate kinase [Porphyridium purpureum]|eukprot:POR9225..scf208_2